MRHQGIKHNSVSHHTSSSLQTYYWIVGVSDNSGRGMIYGCKTSREEAEKIIGLIHNATCEIIESKTDNEDDFTREQRARVLTETGDIDLAYKRFDHRDRV